MLVVWIAWVVLMAGVNLPTPLYAVYSERFGFSSAVALRLQVYSASASTLFNVLPYVLTLIAVAGVIGRTTPPAADGKPYKKQ